jgi:formylglycine-generating enzyme required for sulfatase activity
MCILNIHRLQVLLSVFTVVGCVSAPAVADNSSLSLSAELALKPHDSFKECDKCPDMVVVPAGRFIMGSAANEKNRDNNEGPAHIVTIESKFAVGRFHITVDQFAAFVSETNYDAGTKCLSFDYGQGKWEERPGHSWRNPGFSQDGTHPAVCLNWNDAKAYADWLARKTGKDYRLLSETEWEYAARGQTEPRRDPRYSFGDDEKDLCRYGNGADLAWKGVTERTWPIAPCDDGYAYTSPVGAFEANNFGLFDMRGNAWQWTEDCYRDNYTYRDTPLYGEAWTDENCRDHVIRGGSWTNIPSLLRAAARHPSPTMNRFDNIGFRVGRTLGPPGLPSRSLRANDFEPTTQSARAILVARIASSTVRH